METRMLLGLLMVCIICGSATGAEDFRVSGRVVDAETGDPLVGANVILEGVGLGLPSEADGNFTFSHVPRGAYTISISYIGFKVLKKRINVSADVDGLILELERTIIMGQEIVVTATRARTRFTPATFSNITSDDLEGKYTVQAIPQLLAELPSTSFYSESGTGLGYNYLSLRGFDQRRISVMINGVPQNDPEDHDVYWVDFPDLTANLEDIQVQRGAGSSFYGPPAIGGTVNLVTSVFSPVPEARVGVGFGTFNTQKYTLKLNSGLVNNSYAFYARFSKMLSDGYRHESWVDMMSYFFGAARYTEHTSMRIHVYGGPIKDHLAFYGIPKSFLDDRELRKMNFLAADPVVKDQIENFDQPHYELLHNWNINESLILNNTLFYIQGDGFFDYDGSWADTTYYRLSHEYGFHPTDNPGKSLIRAFVGNKQGGWLPRLTYRYNRGELNVGSELRYHQSLHWGNLKWAQNLPKDVPSNRHYYEYKGAKRIASLYCVNNYQPQDKMNLHASLQTVFNQYRIFDEKYVGTDFRVNYLFLNPRIGINYNVTRAFNTYFSYSRTEREPRLKNLYDAAESSGGAVPQFELNGGGEYDFDSPLVDSEVLNDYELGFIYATDAFSLAANLFWMDFRNEIIKSGGLDRFGQPITGNAERTTHMGFENAGWLVPVRGLKLSGNISFSRNTLDRYTYFDVAENHTQSPEDPDSVIAFALDGNRIAGFPGIVWNAAVSYEIKNAKATLWAHHEGRKYTTNFEGKWYDTGNPRPSTVVDPYTVYNGSLAYHVEKLGYIRNMDVLLQIFNIGDALYATNGFGEDFFPGATRHIFIGVEVGI